MYILAFYLLLLTVFAMSVAIGVFAHVMAYSDEPNEYLVWYHQIEDQCLAVCFWCGILGCLVLVGASLYAGVYVLAGGTL